MTLEQEYLNEQIGRIFLFKYSGRESLIVVIVKIQLEHHSRTRSQLLSWRLQKQVAERPREGH